MSDPWTATLRVVDALDAAGVPCAIGGSLAMATLGYVRATNDGDVNIFVDMTAAEGALRAMADGGIAFDLEAAASQALARGDARIRVDGVRVDLFFNSIPLHEDAARRARTVRYEGRPLRVLAAEDLVVLKAMFDRGKDWVDIERIVGVLGPNFDRPYCRRQLAAHVGEDDPTVHRLDRIYSDLTPP